VGKQKAAVRVSGGAVQCMGVGENENLERQEWQNDSAGKEKGNAVETGSWRPVQGMHKVCALPGNLSLVTHYPERAPS
jgi:hypothetical protein